MKFTLMTLPYAPDALEPIISKETIGFHHGKHLAGYVNNLNGLLEGSPLAGLPLEEILSKRAMSGKPNSLKHSAMIRTLL